MHCNSIYYLFCIKTMKYTMRLVARRSCMYAIEYDTNNNRKTSFFVAVQTLAEEAAHGLFISPLLSLSGGSGAIHPHFFGLKGSWGMMLPSIHLSPRKT